MQTREENICCHNSSAIRAPIRRRLKELQLPLGLGCITDHPGFEANCANPWVMEHAVSEWRGTGGPLGDEEPAHQ